VRPTSLFRGFNGQRTRHLEIAFFRTRHYARERVPEGEGLARTPQVRRCAREDVPHSTRPVKIPADTSYGTVHASPAGASNGTAQPRNWVEGFRSDTTDTTAVQLRWLVSLQSLHTPLHGICAGQRPDESDQHGGAGPNLPAHSRRTSTPPVCLPRLRRSQPCDPRPKWSTHPTHFGYPHRVHEKAPVRRFRRSGAL
jgi:hypothetical protein